MVSLRRGRKGLKVEGETNGSSYELDLSPVHLKTSGGVEACTDPHLVPEDDELISAYQQQRKTRSARFFLPSLPPPLFPVPPSTLTEPVELTPWNAASPALPASGDLAKPSPWHRSRKERSPEIWVE